ncbi:MAG TPA: GTPase domain-containing protein, partial [Eoetvoesiella sp.]
MPTKDPGQKASAGLKQAVLRLAVVGHTNTGKTSLLRTLTRDPDFGDVRDSPGTTRHVEGARLLVEGLTVVELFDTPGMEDGIALLDYLDQLAQRSERLDGPDRIRRFLNSPESKRRFEQEARVLHKLLDCDAALYVVDVRDPVLGKHKDELAILASCGHPLLPVLNFTHSPEQRVESWREALARLGLHAMVEF